MAARLLPVVKFVIKGSLAGAAVYVAYDQGLLGSGTQGAEALKKAQEALPPAIQEWTNYIGWELPPTPKFDFSPSDSWNKGVQTVMSALSVAPARACEYTVEGWKWKVPLNIGSGDSQACSAWKCPR
ncbi:MICOS complex subunit MIC13 isoform X1 [Struthio camelus]|uniref:MICOS complex subunit MIC13 isoform X1 n=1 Tax=Struthio camelus TaxID=8801 RepID=UPI0036040DEA